MAEEQEGLHQAGSNVSNVKRDIKDGVQKIERYKQHRKAANEGIAQVKSDLAAKGIPKKALTMAMSYLDMTPEQREGFDVAYVIAREALELPITADQEEMELKVPSGE